MRNRLIIAVALLLALPLGAQRADFMRRGELLVGGGTMNYLGDLNNQHLFSTPRAGFYGGVRQRLDNRWSLRATFAHGTIAAPTDCQPLRNLSFRSRIYELAAVAEFDFRPFGTGGTESPWTPYLFGGLGVFRFNPEASYTDSDGSMQWVALQPLRTEGQGTSAYPQRKQYALLQLCMPFGMGVRVRINKSLSFSAEYGFRKTWTDYLDDVSTTYVGADYLRAEVDEGALAAMLADRSGEVQQGYVNAAGIKRGDDSLNDWYGFLNITLGVRLETLFGWMRSKRCEH